MTTESYEVQYSIQAPGVDYYHNGTISTDNQVILNLPTSIIMSLDDNQNKGIYLTTNSNKVTVIGQNLISGGSSDTFLVLPTTVMNEVTYMYYGVTTPGRSYSILIVRTENNTMIKLTASQSQMYIGLHRGMQYSFVIDRLQTIY